MTTSDWRPAAEQESIFRRAAALSATRNFFAARNVIEVETPVLCGYSVTEPHISSIGINQTDQKLPVQWLRTSPEYHMKRLLAAGYPDIYQIGKAFRNDESGPQHQPEFTLIEWYRLGFDLNAMISESCALLTEICQLAGLSMGAHERMSYSDAFKQSCDLDPLTAETPALKAAAKQRLNLDVDGSLELSLGSDRQAWLDLLCSHLVHPSLPTGKLIVIDSYPAEQALLARINPEDTATALRFEIFLNGIELANGFNELNCASEQQARFTADRQRRQTLGLADMEIDPYFIDALEAGLPDCSGVAVGLDRLLMTAGDYSSLEKALSFVPGH